MRNGVKDAFEMIGISKSLDKIIKLRKKYDNKELLLKIDSKTSLEFSKHFTTCYININNNRVIKYSYGSMSGLVMSAAAGATLGLANSPIRFVTKDKTIANHKFIKSNGNILMNKESNPIIDFDIAINKDV